MKALNLFSLILLISCQKPKSEATAISSTIKPEKEIEISTEKKETFLKTDTISVSNGEESNSKDYILANMVSQKADKDSILTAEFQLDFYKNKIKTNSVNLTIKGYDKGSDWSATYGLSFEGEKNSPFINICCGFGACGYAQNHYLYHLKDNNLQLVYNWENVSDSGWGTWVEFINPTESEPNLFYCKRVAFDPDDENDEMGIEKHSDSIAFQLKNNHWTKKLLSAKDKTYFEVKKSFDDFHSAK